MIVDLFDRYDNNVAQHTISKLKRDGQIMFTGLSSEESRKLTS